MITRLVLDWGFRHRVLVDYVDRSQGQLTVVCDDHETVESLREEGIQVIAADPTDPDALAEFDTPDEVVVAARSSERTRELANAAITAFPATRRVGLFSLNLSQADRDRMASLFDRTVDANESLRTRITAVANAPATLRAHRVRSLLSAITGELAIFTHDNPDPDALASASALERIAERLGVRATTYYYGQITHQSSRAFVNVLDLDPTRLEPGDPPPDAEAIALVDHANPGVNDSLPPDISVDLIFDHHTPGAPVDARYVDLRESLGATSTIMTEYLRQFDIVPDPGLATALVYGITTDTRSFSRQVSIADFEAAAFLWPTTDHGALTRIENPGVSRETLDTIAQAVTSRRIEQGILAACAGRIGERDALGQAADLLLQMEGVDVTMVYGIVDDVVEVSARARGGDRTVDLAAIMRDAFAPIGSAGGHEEMAGATIPLGILAETDGGNEDVISIVREVIDERFFETVLGSNTEITIELER